MAQGMAGVIFDTQRYSIHDGPGIRTILFLKGCPLRCPWCSNPESQKKEPELFWTKERCIGCKKCMDACEHGAITERDGKIAVLWDKCVHCGGCARACCSGALEMVGRAATIKELMEIALRDRAFYERSGGGVTLSGGEPLSQSAFARGILKICRENKIHTAIETCGHAKREDIQNVLPYTDLFLLDLKIMDPQKHREVVGAGNKIILENAKYIAESGAKIVIRTPVVPGVNDDRGNLGEIVRFAKKIGADAVNFLPYHRLGEAKYEKIGRDYSLKNTAALKDADLQKAVEAFSAAGILISAGG